MTTKKKLSGSTALAGDKPDKKDPLERIKAMGGVRPLSLSIPELVALSGLSRTTIYESIKARRLSVRKVGRRTVVPADEARRFIAGESAAGEAA
jgi:hypothetical protein